MAIDFDALDLVRTQNKAKMYEQKKREQLLLLSHFDNFDF